MTWACLLKRVFAIDVELCPLCGGRLQIIAAIVDDTKVSWTSPSGRRILWLRRLHEQ
jgi:hypothetical protein